MLYCLFPNRFCADIHTACFCVLLQHPLCTVVIFSVDVCQLQPSPVQSVFGGKLEIDWSIWKVVPKSRSLSTAAHDEFLVQSGGDKAPRTVNATAC